MALTFNVRLLEKQNLHLKGEMTPAEVDILVDDELLHITRPLRYDFEIVEQPSAYLVTGAVALDLDCECARCLKTFVYPLRLNDIQWLMEIEGEEAVAVENDLVDLIPLIREDVVLSFPQHPLCEADCGGVNPPQEEMKANDRTGKAASESSSAWSVLDKLKL